jgi:polysaccharide export outer membrane protein
MIVLLAVSFVTAQDPDVGENNDPEAEAPAYQVGIADVLRVVVWGEEELSMVLTVRPDGMITLPLVNDIPVVGLSTVEIRDEITEKLKVFVNDPAVTVILEQYNSFRVFILGEVNQQGILQFQRPTRFLQALASAGGLTEFSKKDAVILRSVDGSDWRMPVDLKKLLSGSPTAQDPYVQPNDTILVF